jgi:histidyl-tRNA synthetase
LAEYIGNPEKITDITVAIDKLDKIGLEAVNEELKSKGLSEKAVSDLQPVLHLEGGTDEKLSRLSGILSGSAEGLRGIEEMKELFGLIEKSDLSSETELDLTLARGLNYYTGAIIEVKSKDVAFGSICGGGRYDNLTGVFGLDGISGVGVSFGADRIYDVLNHLNLFENINISSTEALIVNFGETEIPYSVKIADILRQMGVRTELYPDAAKMKKQLSYADAKKIPYIIMAGADEIKSDLLTVKIMSTGEQRKISFIDIASFVKVEIKKEQETRSV